MRKGDLTMRERTTWNRDQITAAKTVTADPYAMNQDHLQQQPKADKYLTGDPSSFAEDITEPNTWDREYAGGTTERNEIGMPAFRGETFNHAEKSASMDEKTLVKKADLCTTVAHMILKGRKFATTEAKTEAVESQAVALMYMPNADLIQTASRLAAQEDFPGGQFPEKSQEQQAQSQQDQQQQAGQQQQAAYQQAVQQCMQALQQGDQQGAMGAIQQLVEQATKMHQAKKAAEEGKQQQEQGQGKDQQAAQEGQEQGQGGQQQQQAQMDNQALEQMLGQAIQTQVQAADYDAKKGPAINPPGYGPANGPQAGGAKSTPGTKAAAEDQQQQGQGGQQQAQQQDQQQGQGQGQQQAQQQVQVQPQGQGGQQQQGSGFQQADDQLLDEMLMGPQGGGGGMNEVDIEMEPSAMDMGEVVLSSTDDEVLKTLFANEETQDAEQAQQAQQQKQGGMARTASTNASTRTLGTRPTGGVSRVGGAPSTRTASDAVDSLTALWPSAPDVREAFNMR